MGIKDRIKDLEAKNEHVSLLVQQRDTINNLMKNLRTPESLRTIQEIQDFHFQGATDTEPVTNGENRKKKLCTMSGDRCSVLSTTDIIVGNDRSDALWDALSLQSEKACMLVADKQSPLSYDGT